MPQDLGSTPADVAITLDGLAHFVTPDLARDLSPEIIAMLNHSRPNIRKRAILAIYKVLMKYPETAMHARTRLEEKLEDSDAGSVPYLCLNYYRIQILFRCRRGYRQCPLRARSHLSKGLLITSSSFLPSSHYFI